MPRRPAMTLSMRKMRRIQTRLSQLSSPLVASASINPSFLVGRPSMCVVVSKDSTDPHPEIRSRGEGLYKEAR